MSEASLPRPAIDFGDRFEQLGRELREREAAHADSLASARGCVEKLHAAVASALDDFHRGAALPQLEVTLSAIRSDDKHVRSVEFELLRGRHRAIVTAKSRGEVTLVGPFHSGKTEGPCRSFPFDSGDELRNALGDFLAQFLEAASTP
jgi:thymidine phosphorylase